MFKCRCAGVGIGLLNINVDSCPCWGSNAKVSMLGSTCILGMVSNLVPMFDSQCRRTWVPKSKHQHRNGFITSKMCTEFRLSTCRRRDLQVGWVIINVVWPGSTCSFQHVYIEIDKSKGSLLFCSSSADFWLPMTRVPVLLSGMSEASGNVEKVKLSCRD